MTYSTSRWSKGLSKNNNTKSSPVGGSYEDDTTTTCHDDEASTRTMLQLVRAKSIPTMLKTMITTHFPNLYTYIT